MAAPKLSEAVRCARLSQSKYSCWRTFIQWC